jgi:hypothetical protein
MTKPRVLLRVLSQNRDSASRVSLCYGLLKRGTLLVILLAGGAKPTQDKDIKTALKLARLLRE